MVTLKALLDYTNSLLCIDRFADYCPNGLQVEGRPQVSRLVSGVTASMELIEAAIDAQADAIVVHHGYFWKGEDACVTGHETQTAAASARQPTPACWPIIYRWMRTRNWAITPSWQPLARV